jgi:hypothetical protein
MDIMTSYRLFLLNFIFTFFTISIFLRILQKNITSIVDFIILFIFIFIIFLLNRFIIFKRQLAKQSVLYLLFLLYLIINITLFNFYRVLFLNLNFFDITISSIFEFKVTIISFFIFVGFFLIKENEREKFETFIIYLLKIGLIYTFVEQFFSLIGGRFIFETVYSYAGIVSDNLLDLKSLGIFRVWGVVGSTQLLGIYHLLLLSFYLFGKSRSKLWIILSVFGIIVSTSKTAYVIMIIMLFVFLIINKRYYLLTISIVPLLLGLISLIIFFDQNFTDSFINYFYIMIGKLKFNNEVTDFEKLMFNFQNYSFLFGQGLNYSYMDIENIESNLREFYYISADYSFLSLLNQFGIVGYFLFSLIFCFNPIKNFIENKKREHNMILIILWLSTFHYSLLSSKLIMLYVSYSIFVVYFSKKE